MHKKNILIFLQRSDLAQVRQVLVTCENYVRKNTDTHLVLVYHASTTADAAEIRKEKTFATLEAAGQVTLVENQAGLEALQGGLYHLVLAGSIELLNASKDWVSKNVGTATAGTLYAGKTAAAKSSLIARIRNNTSNLLAQFFTTEKNDLATSGYAVAGADAFTEILSYTDLTKDDPFFSIVYYAEKLGYHMVEIPVKALSKPPVKTSLPARIIQTIAYTWKWNVTIPVKQTFSAKNRTSVAITSGKHPFYRLAFFAIALVLLFGIPYLSFDYGMIWDEKSENEYSKDVLKYYLSGGDDTTCFDTRKPLYSHQINYGTFINLVSTAANETISPFGEYETRHVLVALLSAIGMIFTGRIARRLGNPAIGCLGMLFLLISPHYFGQGMNNHKDVPFAAGYIVSIYYLIRYLDAFPKPSAALLAKLILAFGFTISVRIGGLLLIAYLVMFTGIVWLYYMRKHGNAAAFKIFPRLAWQLFVIGFISYFIGILFWPWGMRAPFTNPIKALTEFTQYSNIKNYELFEGKILFMSDKPWYYLPKHIFINTPLYIWAGLLLAVIPMLMKRYRTAFIYLLLFVSLFPVFYAVYKHSNLYNGWRQFIFTYPPLVVLSALGWGTLAALSRSKIYRLGIGIVIIAALAHIGVQMAKDHPHEYVYYNEYVGGTKGAYGNYELDYYSNSCREAAEWIANQEPNKKLTIAINNEPLTASYYAHKINPKLEFTWVRDYEEERTPWDYAIYTTRTYSKNQLLNGAFPPKGTVYQVTAGGAPVAVVVKRETDDMYLGYNAYNARNNDSAYYYFNRAAIWNDKDEEAFRMKGNALTALQRPEEAIKALQTAIDIFPENYMAHCNMGLVYLNLYKNYDKALEYFNKSTALKINYIEGYYYAAACELTRNNYMGAIPYLEDALEYGGNIPEVYYNLGLAYLNTGSYNQAEQAMLNCISLNPNAPMNYRLLGEIYTKLGKQQEAQMCMQKYRELGGQ